MAISRDEAALALLEIDRTAARSDTLNAYNRAGPVLMIWGAVWAVGYVMMGVLPANQWGPTWWVVDAAGLAATIWLLRRAAKGPRSWLPLLLAGAITAFIWMTYRVFSPASLSAHLVFPGLVCGMAYIIAGVVRMPRLAIVGVVIGLGAFIGFSFLQPWLAFWMAAIGGGGLFLGGYWMRRA
jgi:hypothetical protein